MSRTLPHSGYIVGAPTRPDSGETVKAKPDPLLIALGAVTLVLSSYGLFELATTYAQTPASLAIPMVAGFDLFAIGCGRHALVLARAGDSPAGWNFLTVLAALVAAVLQYERTRLAHDPQVIGLMFATFPLATVVMFEGSLRHVFRVDGRAAERVAPPRASFELLQWVVFPRATWAAFKLGMVDRSLGGDGAFKLAYVGLQQLADQGDEQPPRRLVELHYSLPENPALGSGRVPVESGPARDELGAARTVAELVRTAIETHGPDRPAVVAEVVRMNPAVKLDTVRRSFDKIQSERA